MLEAIRARSASILVKILFVLLIVSFGAWGIGDVIRGGAGRPVIATVGKVDITPEEFKEAYQREMRYLQNVFRTQIDRDQARAIGVPDAALGRLVNDTLLGLEARDLGLIAPDEAVRQRIQSTPDFFNTQKRFDPNMFREVLRANGLSEGQFVAQTRREITQGQIVDSLAEVEVAPRFLAEALFRHRMEKRVARVATIADAGAGDAPTPDDEALAKFHQDNAQAFTAPEYRALTLLVIDAAKLAGDIEIADEVARAAYDSRRDEFNTEEKRTLRHLVVAEEAKAKAAVERLGAGEAFAAVAKDVAGMEGDSLDIGEVSRIQLLPEMADAAFKVAEGGHTTPIKSPLGWHVIEVVKIAPARQRAFDEVKGEIKADLAHDKAVDSLFALSNQIEDKLGAGATLEEAARQIGLEARKIVAVDRRGRDRDGKPVEGLPTGQNVLKTLFETPEGTDTPLTEAGSDAYFVARIDAVTPPALKPLADIRAAVVEAWTANWRRDQAKAKADALLAELKAGKPLDEVAAAAGLETSATEPFLRTDGAILPRDLVQALFAAKPGEAAIGRGRDGWLLGVLTEVQAADPAAQADLVASLADALSQSLRNDTLGAYTTDLRKDHPVKVNTKMLEEF